MSEADMIIESLKNSGKKVEEFYMSNKTSNKNVGSIEKDIKILQEKDCMWHYPETRIEEAIENVLADYTRQKQINEEHQKENGLLREKVKELDTKNDELLKDLYSANCIISDLTDSIPKQKIKDKIEELENIKVQLPVQHLKDAQIKVLQELLQESEDK